MSYPTGTPEALNGGLSNNGATEDEQRVVYSSSILFEKQPLDAMESLTIRRQQAKLINKELSEWFTAYGRLRLHYVEELKKIHKRGEALFTNSNSNLQNNKLDALGLCTPLWSDVLAILNDEITLFDQSTRKMGRDMIAPLRLFTRNNDSNLVEMDELSQLASSLQSNPNSSLLQDEWTRRAPYFFEIFENYDYERLLLLKDVFLKYQTDVGDVVTQFKKDNESGLEHALNFNVDDEINRFSQDVIKSNFPVENIKIAPTSSNDKSRTSTDGFTSNSNLNNNVSASSEPTNKRHSNLLSPRRFHLKKNSEHHTHGHGHGSDDVESTVTEASESTTYKAPPSSSSTSKSNKRLTSGTSMLSTTTLPGASGSLSNNGGKKEKNSMRSKFGSIFKSHKKAGKGHDHPSAIPESDTASITTETTVGSTNQRSNQRNKSTQPRNRNQSVASSTLQTPTTLTHDQRSYNTNSPVRDTFQQTPSATTAPVTSTAKPTIQPSLRESNDYSINDSKPLPTYPSTNDVQSSERKQSVNSLYEPMRPTKRSDSLSSGNNLNSQPQLQPQPQPQLVNSASTVTTDSTNINTAPLTSSSAITSIPATSSTNRGMDNIPESSPLVSSAPGSNTGIASPPPPPIARKTASEISSIPTNTNPTNARISHGSVPTPPVQRKSMDQQQLLQPAATGTNQPETTNNILAKNVTGGGSLMGGQIMHPSLTTPGLNSSIVELFNATFKDGKLARSNAIGEVAFSYIMNENNKKLPSEIGLQIISKSNGMLPNFMVNPMFLQQSSSDTGLFTISDPTQIAMRTVGGLKYMLNNPVPPIIITPIWKHEDKQSTVIISIKPTPELNTYLAENSLALSNVMVSVSIQGALVTSAATKPPGSLNKEKGRVTWILSSPVVFNSSKKEERLVARFMTSQRATESETGVQIRFNISNDDGAGRIDFLNTDMEIKASGVTLVEDPFGDNDSSAQLNEWSEVPTLKSLVAGSYSGHS